MQLFSILGIMLCLLMIFLPSKVEMPSEIACATAFGSYSSYTVVFSIRNLLTVHDVLLDDVEQRVVFPIGSGCR